MKRVFLFLLLALPFYTKGQITLNNGSFSNGNAKGSDGNISVTSLVGSSGLLLADAPQMRASAFLPSGKVSIPNIDPPFVANIDSTGIGESISILFSLSNIGSSYLTIDTILVTGDYSTDFSLLLSGMMKKIPPGATTSFNIQFNPASLGLRTALVSIYSNDPQNSVYSFAILGKGVSPHPTIPARNLLATNISDQYMHFKWTNGNGSRRVVLVSEEIKAVAKEPIPAAPAPNDSTKKADAAKQIAEATKAAPAEAKKAETAKNINSVVIPDGTLLAGNSNFKFANEYAPQGQIWKVIYVGSDSSANVTGLKALTTYQVTVIEFNGDAETTKYLNNSAPVITPQTLDSLSAPTAPASNITFTNVFTTQMQLSFVPGNGANHLVVLKAGSAVDFIPSNNLAYGLGDVGNGNIVVSNGNTNSVNLTGLTPSTNYFVKIFEFNAGGNQTRYLTTNAPTASRSTQALPNVYVITPANGATNQNVMLNVTSIAFAGATTYTIELNDSSGFTGSSFVKSGGRTQNFSGLHYGKTYYARVKTNLSPDFGKVTTFSTSVPNVQVSSPANGAIDQKVALNVTATSLAGASEYTIELNEAADFSGISIIQSGTRTQNFTGLKYDQQYFTRVKTDNYPVFGPSTSFHTALPNVYVTGPANGAINQNVSLNITANAFTGATTYTIELNTASDFGGISFVQSGNRTQNFSGLEFATTYYARVKTDLSPVHGKATSFTTAPASWFAYVTSPASNAVNVNNSSVNISSSNVIGANSYTIQLSESPTFDSIDFEVTGPTRTLTFSGLKYNTIYYNRVLTDKSTEYGQVRSFTTRTAESLAYVTTPANSAVNINYNPTVTSNNVPEANYYTIQLSESPAFDLVNFEMTGATRTLSFTGLKYNTVYYSRVRTDLSSIWGAVRSFTTTNPANYSYLTSPADNSNNVSWVVNLTSNTVPGASQYIVEANTASDFSGTSILKMGGRTISFTLSQDQTYWVRIKTNLYDVWGVTKSFSTGNALSLAYVVSPVNGSTGVPTSVVVKANALPGATNYKIELNTASDFTGTSVLQSGSRSQSFTLAENTAYFIRVQSNLAAGQWGPTNSFTTINPAARSNADWIGIDSDTTVVVSNSLKVFPNPFTDKLSVLVEDIDQVSIELQLIDLNGVVLKSWRAETNKIVEIKEEIAQGFYLLKVNKRNEVSTTKVLKL